MSLAGTSTSRCRGEYLDAVDHGECSVISRSDLKYLPRQALHVNPKLTAKRGSNKERKTGADMAHSDVRSTSVLYREIRVLYQFRGSWRVCRVRGNWIHVDSDGTMSESQKIMANEQDMCVDKTHQGPVNGLRINW